MRSDANAGHVRTAMKRLPRYLMALVRAPRLSDLPWHAVQLLVRLRYAGYLIVSGISLSVDLANFLLLLHINVPAVQASVLAYISGLIVHWLLSSRLVFFDKIQPTVALRRHQKMLFVISALLGLAVTAVIIECGLRLGAKPSFSKLAAIGVSFHVTYIVRRVFVFR